MDVLFVTFCFTGPRPDQLHGYTESSRLLYSKIVDFTMGIILKCSSEKPGSVFISGGAQGFDQLAFWAVEKAKKICPELMFSNTLYIPFDNQPMRWSQEGMFGQSEYKRMRKSADATMVISPNPAPNDYPSIVKAMHGRNHAMVNDSDLVIALLAGRSLDWEHSKGGTAECVQYALSHNRPVLAIRYMPTETTNKFSTERLDSFSEENSQLSFD